MYGFNQPNHNSANYYHTFVSGYDPETTFVFPASEKELYDTFIWTGQELARHSAEVRKEATRSGSSHT